MGTENVLSTGAGAVSSTSGGGILKLFSRTLFFVFLFIFLINIAYTALETRSFEPVIKEIGGNLVFASLEISELSKEIVEKGIIFDTSESIAMGIWNFIKTYGMLFMYLYIIWAWIYMIIWIVPYVGLANESDRMKVVIVSVIIFILLQSLFLVINAGVNHEIDSFSQAMTIMAKPLTCYADLYRAGRVMVKPFADISSKIVSNV